MPRYMYYTLRNTQVLDQEAAKTEPKSTSISSQETGYESLTNQLEQEEQQTKAVLDELKNYRNAGNLVSDQEFYPRVATMLDQFGNSFNRIHNEFAGIAESIELDKKGPCNK